jgi:hypothetical protein
MNLPEYQDYPATSTNHKERQYFQNISFGEPEAGNLLENEQ